MTTQKQGAAVAEPAFWKVVKWPKGTTATEIISLSDTVWNRQQTARTLPVTDPDFPALRAARNAVVEKMIAAIAKEHGFDLSTTQSNFDPDACYCACPDGPCEHKWDGEIYVSEDGCCQSTTCSRCGMTSMSHSLRTAE